MAYRNLLEEWWVKFYADALSFDDLVEFRALLEDEIGVTEEIREINIDDIDRKMREVVANGDL